MEQQKNIVIVVMGVSGAGKTTVGKLLSNVTGLPFFDGDDFHPKANVAKMASGQPLDDADRLGWLQQLHKKQLSQFIIQRCR